ncbi:MAG: hypothetical protein FWD53_05910 [Phycisphaerales bacterium]|nr:hypothetical protein [Phycisphaerales bacterium]
MAARRLVVVCVVVVFVLPMFAAGQPTDPISKTYIDAAAGSQRVFNDSIAMAQKLREDKIKQATDVAKASIIHAANTMGDARRKAANVTLTQYDVKIKDLERRGKQEEATKIREDKEKLQELITADDERVAAAFAELVGFDPTAKTELRPNEVIDPRQVKQQRILVTDFFEKHASGFPSSGNLARGGNATASSTNRQFEDPVAVLGGVRRRNIFSLDSPRGWWAATWEKPVSGQYIVVFPRTSPATLDQWGKASIEINGRAVPVESMGPQLVLVVDLGKVTSIRSVKINIDGADRPGFAGLEIHREMKK